MSEGDVGNYTIVNLMGDLVKADRKRTIQKLSVSL